MGIHMLGCNPCRKVHEEYPHRLRAACAGRSFAIGSRALLIGCILLAARNLAAQSRWVAIKEGSRLTYGHFEKGDRIADFSWAGYRGGGVALPSVTQMRLIQPSTGDQTTAIQTAIDEVSRLPLKEGHRGAVVLAPGQFHCSQTLNLRASGVVLRGLGTGDQRASIIMTGAPHLALNIAGAIERRTVGSPTFIKDAYVPSGTYAFHVANPTNFRPGDLVQIVKPVTDAWLHFMGMDTLGARNGQKEHWVKSSLEVRRRITKVVGDTISVEVPLMDSYDATFTGVNAVQVSKIEEKGDISEVGLENLSVIAPARRIALGEPEFDGVRVNDATDGWISNVSFAETTNSVAFGSGARRMTVVSTDVIQHIPVSSPAKPFDFSSNGSQILFDRCTATGDNVFYFATQGGQQGPVVLLNCTFTGNGRIEPHQRWSTGLLVDNCDVPDGGIDFRNRGQMGTGHGWTIGWSVAWNNRAQSFIVQQPPGTENWSIGNIGKQENPPMPAYDARQPVLLQQGIIESAGVPVFPRSLYLKQLADRLGQSAVKNIGHDE